MKKLSVVLLVGIIVIVFCEFTFGAVSINAGKLLITEVAMKETNDWLELYVVDGSVDWHNHRIYRTASSYYFLPDENYSTGQYIVLLLHEEAGTDGLVDNCWHFYGALGTGLTGTDQNIFITDPDAASTYVDAVIYSDNSEVYTASAAKANDLVAAGMWNTYDFSTGDAGAWTDSDDISSGQTLARYLDPGAAVYADNNNKGDWYKEANPSKGGQNNQTLPVTLPIIERISPEIGQVSGGDEVVITGNYFQDGATVTIGGNPAEIVSVSETQIIAKIPPGELGITNVVVTNPDGGSATLLRGFAYIPRYGDVSGDGTVSAYDAALILRFVVGLISEFPVQQIGAPDQNITPRNYTVSIPELSAKAGSKIQVPIAIDDATGLFAGGISIKYDASVLKAVDALPTKMLNGSYWKANVSLPSEVRFAFATTELMQGSGSLLTIEFQVLPGAEGKSSPLSFSSINLSNSLSIGKIDGLVNILPAKTALLPNYPNPFNPETWIPYKLSQDASVVIYIYSSNGQLVRKLNLGHRPASVYVSKAQAARWDGRDNFGQKVASGIYYYTLQAGEFRATRKMVIFK